jgi:hypothetical protein
VPAVKNLLRDVQPVNNLADGLAKVFHYFGLAQFANDRFGGVSFLNHDSILLSVENPDLELRAVF